MRLPNSFGSIVKLGGNRRRPFAARITTHWAKGETQKYKYLGYYATRKEAMIALSEYNKNPYDLDANSITFAEIFDRWCKEQEGKMTQKNLSAYKSAYKNTTAIQNMKFIDIRKTHLQSVIDEITKGVSTQTKVKHLFGKLYRYALENDIVDKNYAEFVTIPTVEKREERKPFTDEEIEMLWSKSGENEYIEIALILIYSGWRIQELLEITNENVTDEYMMGGKKTKAGKDRKVPIADKIRPLIEKRRSGEFLIEEDGKAIPYYTFYRRWTKLMKELKLDHIIHDTRHTTATLLARVNTPLLISQKILGHAPQNVTENVYVHTNVSEMAEWINKI